jgi:Pyruvate/2-oxoacid:ferredoxin oxidoreductase delta subunit
MEGDGPAAGEPRAMNVIVAGEDAVAIDACLARMMGMEPFDVLSTKTAYGMKLGEADPARIEVAGDRLEDFVAKDFRLPQTLPLKVIPRSLLNTVASIIRFRPYIDRDKCNRCNLCKITCPVGAIETGDSGCEIDYEKCLRCLCCQEVCPYKAVRIRRNLLTRMVWG